MKLFKLKFLLIKTIFIIIVISNIKNIQAGTLKDGPNVGITGGLDAHKIEPAIGWQVLYDFNDNFSLEAAITRQTDKLSGDIGSKDLPDGAKIEMELFPITLSLIGRIYPLERLNIYGLLGAGYYIIRTESEDIHEDSLNITSVSLDTENNIGYHLGLGTGYLISTHWDFFADARLVFFHTRADIDINKASIDNDLDYNYLIFRIGFNYRF